MKIGRIEIRYDYPLSLREWAELLAIIVFAVAVLRALVG
jgi:hypothetical protein